MTITQPIIDKIHELLDHGLVSGLGVQEPGKMCVEAAICAAFGLPHGDDPGCVNYAVRALKIQLNDSNWPSNAARADGLRRLAISQLGTKDTLDTAEFLRRVQTMTIQVVIPIAFRAAAKKAREPHMAKLLFHADQCEASPTIKNLKAAKIAADAADAATAAAYAATAAYAAADAADAAYAAADAADAAYAAAAADAAYAAARGKVLSLFAEEVVQILIAMEAPGCKWL